MADEALLGSEALKLRHQARLADAGFAADIDRLAAAGPTARGERRFELLQLRLPAHERLAHQWGRLAKPKQLPTPDGLREPPHL